MALKLDKITVLVVEDTVPMRKLIVSVLESLGVGRIITANDGADGFEKLQTERPDIIITDWLMQPVDGMEFIKMIRMHPASPNKMVPIIIITGYSAINRVLQARDHGVTEFLVKPFTASDLAKRLAYVINKPRDFVHAGEYFGPDRRRRSDTAPGGQDRRGRQPDKLDTPVVALEPSTKWDITSK